MHGTHKGSVPSAVMRWQKSLNRPLKAFLCNSEAQVLECLPPQCV